MEDVDSLFEINSLLVSPKIVNLKGEKEPHYFLAKLFQFGDKLFISIESNSVAELTKSQIWLFKNYEKAANRLIEIICAGKILPEQMQEQFCKVNIEDFNSIIWIYDGRRLGSDLVEVKMKMTIRQTQSLGPVPFYEDPVCRKMKTRNPKN